MLGVGKMIRRMMIVPLLGAAAGVPYVALNEGVQNTANSMTSYFSSSEKGGELTEEGTGSPFATIGADGAPTIRDFTTSKETSLLYTPPAEDLRDVIRFDVTPEWVKQHWPRVSANVYEHGLEGLRVPLVTGIDAADLHGALTYYFDRHQIVQRVTFDGFTGDIKPLADLVVTYHGFQQAPTRTANLYIKTYNSKPVGALRATYPAVIVSNAPTRQLEVMLEINSTLGEYRMSERFAGLLKTEKLAGRW